MKKPKITPTIIFSIALIAVSTSVTLAHGEKVSPEEAQKAAIFYFLKSFGRVCADRYDCFFISKAELIESYRGDRSWYGFYFTVGTDGIPSRDELYKWAKAGKAEPENGYIFNVHIATDKDIAPCDIVSSGIPVEIWQKPEVEDFIKTNAGTGEVKFLRVFFTTADLRMMRACFEFLVNGRKTAVLGGDIPEFYGTDTISEEPPPIDPGYVDRIWRVIEEKIKLEPTDNGKITFDEVKNSIGRMVPTDTDYVKYLFCDDVPNYYNEGQGAPSGYWGCGPPCATSSSTSSAGRSRPATSPGCGW